MSLLTVIQDVCTELSLSVPMSVIGNHDPQVQQLLGLCNLEGQTFAQLQGPWGGWPELNTTYTFNLVPAGPYTGTTTEGSDLITGLSSTAGITTGYGVAGSGIYQSAQIIAVPPTTAAGTVQMSAVASSSNTNASYNFGQILYSLPTDIRSFINATYWDRNFRWPMLGPLSPVEWEVIVSGISPVGPRIRFRVVDNQMEIQPLPGTDQTDQIAYEYVSNAWCTAADGTPRSASGGVCRFAADTDLFRWPENTLRLGTKYRFLRAKGLPAQDEYKEYMDARDFQLSVSGGARSLRMNAVASGLHFLNYSNVPDTGYGQVTS
jgi:hypothetical protein